MAQEPILPRGGVTHLPRVTTPEQKTPRLCQSAHREQQRVPKSPLLRVTHPPVRAELWWSPRQAFGKVGKSTARTTGKTASQRRKSKPSLLSFFQNLTLEGAHIVAGDIASTNGIIHVIDKVDDPIGRICSSAPQTLENN